CLAATAKKGNMRLLSVILGAASDSKRVSETRRLLDYGFRNYQWELLKKAGQELGKVYLKTARPEMVPVELKEDLGVLVERGREKLVETELAPLPNLKYPIKAGGKVGLLKAIYQGEVLAEKPVYATVEVKRANFLVRSWRWLRDLIRVFLKREAGRSIIY
ncbi:MAG: hypothetical protein ACM3YE_06885, partial [Bacteroidota bacterium]